MKFIRKCLTVDMVGIFLSGGSVGVREMLLFLRLMAACLPSWHFMTCMQPVRGFKVSDYRSECAYVPAGTLRR